MNGSQQRERSQAVKRLDDRIDTLAACVDLEVNERMAEIRKVVTRLSGETRTYADLQDQDIRIETDRQLEAISKRITALETMTMRQAIRWFFSRAW